MVTDGEIPQPDKSILDTIKAMHDNRYRGGGQYTRTVWYYQRGSVWG